ncbi:hypothetical protein SLS60_004384 [Paraconiothyrium brasiliense]|uniref:Uncharacterized protein n=1 Tax=Paraconiothyrium brasiliense TaxID=300254 RepID=A0ABR3RL37_9PLEO
MPHGKSNINSNINNINNMVETAKDPDKTYKAYDFDGTYPGIAQAELRAWKHLLCMWNCYEVVFGLSKPVPDTEFMRAVKEKGWDNEAIMCSFYGLCYRWDNDENDVNEVRRTYRALYGVDASRKKFAKHLERMSFKTSYRRGEKIPDLLYGCGDREKKIPDDYAT